MDSGETYIHLIAPASKAALGQSSHPEVTVSGTPPESMDVSTQELMAQASAAYGRGDLTEERRLLNQVRDRKPDTPYLMSMLGYLAARDGKLDEAIADTEAELKNHPDDRSSIAVLLASYYEKQKKFDKAEATLRTSAASGDLVGTQSLAYFLARQGKHADAVTVWEGALKANPDNRDIEYALASQLYEDKRIDEAVMHAHHSMEGSDDGNLINNNVYLLSEMKRDLPFAEENSRRSIALLEKATSDTPVESANNKTFAASSNMTAAWDTLAYILLLEGKPQEALPWFRAAWLNQPEVTVGNHLGQVYEALHQPGRALSIYRLALGTEKGSGADADRDEAQAAQMRLLAAHITASNDEPDTVQTLRTHHVKRPATVSGSGTVRVVIAQEAITEATLVSGETALKPVLDQVKSLKLPGYTPPNSSGHVLRDAVLYCGKSAPTCDLVFMLRNGLAAEGDAR